MRAEVPLALSEGPVEVAPIPARVGEQFTDRCGEELAAQGQRLAAVLAGEQTVVTDALETGWQRMEQETADQLGGIEGHGLRPLRVPVVLPAEGHLAVGQGKQALIGDGHTVRVAAEVFEDLLGAAQRRFGIDDPFGGAQGFQIGREGSWLLERLECGEEVEFPVVEGAVEGFQKQAPEQAAEDSNGEEEPRAAGDPAVAVRRESAAGHDAVQMGMEQQVLAPGVENGEEADVGAEVLGIASDGEQRLGRGAEQDVVDDLRVVEGEGGDRFRQREDDMEVLDGQQVSVALLEPAGPRQGLAFGAMAVAAGNGVISITCLMGSIF